MLLVETAIFYLLLGAAVGVAVYLRREDARGIGSAFNTMSACLFWPLFVPMLLAAPPDASTNEPHNGESNEPHLDGLSAAIAQVEAELDAALEGLDGWAEDV